MGHRLYISACFYLIHLINDGNWYIRIILQSCIESFLFMSFPPRTLPNISYCLIWCYADWLQIPSCNVSNVSTGYSTNEVNQRIVNDLVPTPSNVLVLLRDMRILPNEGKSAIHEKVSLKSEEFDKSIKMFDVQSFNITKKSWSIVFPYWRIPLSPLGLYSMLHNSMNVGRKDLQQYHFFHVSFQCWIYSINMYSFLFIVYMEMFCQSF